VNNKELFLFILISPSDIKTIILNHTIMETIIKQPKKIKKIKSVPLLCWDIYAEHLSMMMGKNKVVYQIEAKKGKK
jgi:hypothetical protein